METTELTTAPPEVQQALSIYDRISDPMDAIAKLGSAFHISGMFGCSNAQQGQILAMACYCEKRNPMEIVRNYHLFDGKLSMRADAMLANFLSLGGKHKIIQRDENGAAVELTIDGNTQTFSFTFEQAKEERFVWGKPKPNGERVLKDNWATPRGRMQMLWARVVSDGVRTMRPDVVAGYYTPEEVQDFGPGVRPALSPEGEQRRNELEEQAKAERVAAYEKAKAEEQPQPAPAAPAAPAAPEIIMQTEAVKMVTEEQLQRIVELCKATNMPQEVWGQILDRFNVTTARDLTEDDASRLIAFLDTQRQQQDTKDQLDEWAESALSN